MWQKTCQGGEDDDGCEDDDGDYCEDGDGDDGDVTEDMPRSHFCDEDGGGDNDSIDDGIDVVDDGDGIDDGIKAYARCSGK